MARVATPIDSARAMALRWLEWFVQKRTSGCGCPFQKILHCSFGCAVAVRFGPSKARVIAKPGSIAKPLHVVLLSHQRFAS